MRFRIDPASTVYRLADLEDLSLRDHLVLEQQTADLGRRLDLPTIDAMNRSLIDCKDDAERRVHPDGPWVLAVCIWAARRKAGEDVTFEQAIDFPMKKLEYLPDPEDRKPADPTRARSRQGSARAAKRPAAKRSASAKTSKRASTGG